MSAKSKRTALRRLRGLVGETVYVLCAKVDPSAYSSGPHDGEPAIDPSTLGWLHATIVSLPDTEDGLLAPDDEIQIRDEIDGSTTYYERRYIFTYDEAVALKIPKVPAP
jgi:hypothetical protein